MANYPLSGILIPIEDANTTADLWCVYEHHIPPEIIYVNACRLVDLFRLREGRTNSEWHKMFVNGGPLTINLIMITTDKLEAEKHALLRVKQFNPFPRCNLYGWNIERHPRKIVCSNGMVYNTQGEAADALGIPQGNISRVLNGHLSQTRGYRFAYADENEVRP